MKDEYKYLEGDLIDSFFYNNAISKLWYKNAAAWSACGPARMAETQEVEAFEEMQLYPNPAHNQIVIPVSPLFTELTTCTIYNNAGEKMYTEVFNAKAVLQRNIDIHLYPPGMYYVRMEGADTIDSAQFVKQ